MAMTYPLMLTAGLLSAICIRIKSGSAADVLKSSLSAAFKTGASYPCLFTFKKPFTDHAKLEQEFHALAEELGMQREYVKIVFEDEVPKPFPTGHAVENDHCKYQLHNELPFSQRKNHHFQGQLSILSAFSTENTRKRWPFIVQLAVHTSIPDHNLNSREVSWLCLREWLLHRRGQGLEHVQACLHDDGWVAYCGPSFQRQAR